jgi:hypothetical protein
VHNGLRDAFPLNTPLRVSITVDAFSIGKIVSIPSATSY